MEDCYDTLRKHTIHFRALETKVNLKLPNTSEKKDLADRLVGQVLIAPPIKIKKKGKMLRIKLAKKCSKDIYDFI